MATFSDFQGSNTLASGENLGIGDLPIASIDDQRISCWRLSEEELAEINRTGVVWVSCLHVQPAMYVSGKALVLYNGAPVQTRT